jgi:hypothetical protein
MNEGVNPELKLHGSFVARGAGSWLWESDGFIVFASCVRIAVLVNLREISKRFDRTPLEQHMRVA